MPHQLQPGGYIPGEGKRPGSHALVAVVKREKKQLRMRQREEKDDLQQGKITISAHERENKEKTFDAKEKKGAPEERRVSRRLPHLSLVRGTSKGVAGLEKRTHQRRPANE